MSQNKIICDVLVIGSGPGGAMTAMVLSEAGVDVVLAEEGPQVALGAFAPYSLEEMESKYRCSGMTLAFGKPKMTYLEGCCVGGASEINAGLYNEPSPEILDAWAKDFKIMDFGAQVLRSYFKENEKILGVALSGRELGPGSQVLKQGAQALGWNGFEVPRMWDYGSASSQGQRRAMSVSLLPRALQAGCRLFPSLKIERLHHSHGKADYALTQDQRRIYFKTAFICCGAIQTPFLLRKSGIKRNIGDSLKAHPAIRTVACFDKIVSDEQEGVPVYQITEFKPRLTLGGSFSSLPHLALWMAGKPSFSPEDLGQKMGIFYALIMAQGHGRIKHLPGVKDPLVWFDLAEGDLKEFGEGLYRLGEALFAAGANQVYSPLNDGLVFKSLEEMSFLRQGLPRHQLDCSTLHLFSSCPMGEVSSSAVNSWGRLHDAPNLYINDASLLPAPSGANPQALIMAIARRNAIRFSLTN